MDRRFWTGAVLLMLGCQGARIYDQADSDESTSSTSSTTGFPTSATTDPSTTSTSATGPVTTSSTSDDSADSGCAFLCPPDGGQGAVECDVWAQDCPQGEKCMPWANDGGSAWNATKCSPIARDPAGLNEACTVEGSGVSGVDDCDIGLMCWGVDPETLEGACIGMCKGTENDPMCEDACAQCGIYNDGVLALCFPTCNPIAQDCPEGQSCVVFGEHLTCISDATQGDGIYGDPCTYVSECQPGMACIQGSLVPGCENQQGCCTPHCDVQNPSCPNDVGVICNPWFEEPPDIPCLSIELGVCSLMP